MTDHRRLAASFVAGCLVIMVAGCTTVDAQTPMPSPSSPVAAEVVSSVPAGDGGTLTLVLETDGPTKSPNGGHCWRLLRTGGSGDNSVGACGGGNPPSASVVFAAIVLDLPCREAREVSMSPDDTRLPARDGLALVAPYLAEGRATVTVSCVRADGTLAAPLDVPVTA